MRSSDYAVLSPAIAKLGVIVSLLGLGACSSVSNTASLAAPVDIGHSVAYAATADRHPELSNSMKSDAMPYGERTAAPMGFLEMCSRSPMDCNHASDYDPQRIRMLARDNLVLRYRIAMTGRDSGADIPEMQVAATGQAPTSASNSSAPDSPAIDRASLVNGFAAGGIHRLGTYLKVPADVSQAGDAQPAGDAGPVPGVVATDLRPVLSWGNKTSGDGAPQILRASGEVKATMTDVRDSNAGIYRDGDYVRITMDRGALMLMRSVNDQVNDLMRAATDVQTYGVADYWNDPVLARGVQGDCEDFALEKRRLLVEHGVPAAALSIAIVRTRQGEEHAVLMVTTDAGDYVLDNLTYDVRPWRRTGYTWIARQGPGNDLAWVSLAPANTAPSMRPATVYVANAR